VLIPAGASGQTTAVDLAPGRYLIQAYLPGGDVISSAINVSDAEGAKTIQLQAPSSPHEWLSWQQLSGKVLADPDAASLHAPRAHVLGVVTGMSALVMPALVRVWNGAQLSVVPFQSKIVQPAVQRAGALTDYVFTDQGTWVDQQGYYCVVTPSGSGALLAVLPAPWRQSDGNPAIEVLVDGTRVEGSEWPLSISVVVQDSVMASVFGYLTAGNQQLADQVLDVEVAVEALYEKRYNPIAAAGAAYALVRSWARRPDRSPPAWASWFKNLRGLAPWMPDGSILDGWASLTGIGRAKDIPSAAAAFVEAVDRGLPLYTAGVQLLYQGMDVVDGLPDDQRPKRFAEASDIVQQLAMRIDPQQTFTVVDLTASESATRV